MNAKLRAKFEAWPERQQAISAIMKATERGDIEKTRQLVSRFPLLDEWAPYNAYCWSQIAAAAGQLELMNFWRKREMKTRPPMKRMSPEKLLFWAMGSEYISTARGDPARVAKYLLRRGANVEGHNKDYTPLHRAVFMTRPKLVELLIQHGADLSRRYATGESGLQIAERTVDGHRCAAMLRRAGAPLALPRKPKRPKVVRRVDLRESARKLQARIENAVRKIMREHGGETFTAVALASIPHEGYVRVSFDTGKFEGSPWDCTYDEVAFIKFPDWRQAHKADVMRLIDLDGSAREKKPDAFLSRFKKMIVDVLQSLEKKGSFDVLTVARGCQIGIEMTADGQAKYWTLRKSKG